MSERRFLEYPVLRPRLGSMTRPLLPLLTFCVLLLSGEAGAQTFGVAGGAGREPPVKAELLAELSTVTPGQAFRAAVRLEHGPEWHTYGKVLPPDVVGKPTTLWWELPDGWTIEELPWPATHEVPSTDGKTSVGYDGTVYLPVKITPAGKPGDEADLVVTVSALACDPKSCLPVKMDARTHLKVAAEAVVNEEGKEAFASLPALDAKIEPQVTGPKTQRSFGFYLFAAFLGGLILNIMPCVFPVLGIKIMGVARQAGDDKRHIVLHGLAYTAGILLCFMVLGGVVVSLGKSWGFQLQSPAFIYALAAFFLVFGLNMAGVFEIGASAVGVGADLQARHGLSGSFFTGLLAVVVATPCSAPFLGTALAFAVGLPVGQALLMFAMIGLGLAAPFLLLSFAPGLVAALPRPGAWMESFKQGMSFLLFGTTCYMLWVLTGMIEGLPLLFGFFGLVVIALACWVYGRWCPLHRKSGVRLTGGLVAAAFLVAGLWLGWPRPEQRWEEWSPERVSELRKEGVPVYIDFTAKWCFTCQVNKRVYKSRQIQGQIEGKKIALLRADWTNEDPLITDALAALGKAAVPVNVLYVPGRDEPVILSELLTEGGVLEAFSEVP